MAAGHSWSGVNDLSPRHPTTPCRCRRLWYRGAGSGGRQAGLSHEPLTVHAVAGSLIRTRIARVRVQKVAVVTYLAAVGIVHDAELSRKRGGMGWRRLTQQRPPHFGASASARAL